VSDEGIVLLATGGFFDVRVEDEVVRCRLRGRLKKEKKKTDLCVIGDRVTITRTDPGEGFVEAVAPRERVFSRRHPGRGRREDVLVANLEQLFVCFAHGDPPFHPRMLDRFLVLAEHNRIDAVIVANKADQKVPETAAELQRYAAIGYPLIETSATEGAGIDAIRRRLEGRISAFAGPSGVGKTSLLNALDPELDERVATTSSRHTKGRHTTRVARLFRVAGGWVADTPGIRELGTWALDLDDLDECFPEFREYLGRCTYRNCRHDREPGCAIRDAVEAGDIQEERYDSYLRLRDDEAPPR